VSYFTILREGEKNHAIPPLFEKSIVYNLPISFSQERGLGGELFYKSRRGGEESYYSPLFVPSITHPPTPSLECK